jgi:hypothetical protein
VVAERLHTAGVEYHGHVTEGQRVAEDVGQGSDVDVAGEILRVVLCEEDQRGRLVTPGYQEALSEKEDDQAVGGDQGSLAELLRPGHRQSSVPDLVAGDPGRRQQRVGTSGLQGQPAPPSV